MQTSRTTKRSLWPQRIGVATLMGLSLAFPLVVSADDSTIRIAPPAVGLPPIPAAQETAATEASTADATATQATEEATAAAPQETTSDRNSTTTTEAKATSSATPTPPAPTPPKPAQPEPTQPEPAQPASESDALSATADAEQAEDQAQSPDQSPMDAEVATFGSSSPLEDDVQGLISQTGLDETGLGETGLALDADQTRSLSVEPGGDPLLPADFPAWILTEVHRVADVDHFPVGGIPTSQKVNVDDGLNTPMRTALAKYVQQLVGPENFEGLGENVTSDYIRKNLIDEPNGYIAEIATSEGPMYQKWVKLSVTPSQREQLREWNREEIQAMNLPVVAIGLIGLLGFVGLTHVVLKSVCGTPKLKAEVTAADAVAAKKSSGGAVGFLLVLMFLLGIPALLLVGYSTRAVSQQQVIEHEFAETRALTLSEEIQRVAEEAARVGAEAQNARNKVSGELSDALRELKDARSEFLNEQSSARADRQLQGQSSGDTMVGPSTTIRGRGNQTVIIRPR